jgi:choline transport protein
MLTPTTAFLGADAAVHMSEELKNASKTLPRAMIWTSIVNGAMGFVMLITILYTMGDFESVISTPTGYPYQQIFYNATRSRGGATAMSCIIILAAVANGMTNMATASRQLFAFARDEGVPFHRWFATVPQGWEIPLNAVIFTVVFSCILSLVNIGSTYAFNQINSLGICALLSSYIISIGCVFWKRIRNQPLLDCRFSLGKAGIVINALGLCYLAVAFVFSFFPPVNHPPANAMNWSSAVYVFVVGLAVFYYVIRARHQYVGPVAYIRKGL